MGEKTRAEVEEHGRVFLEPPSFKLLKATKIVHVVLVTASCVITVGTGHIEGGVVLLAGFVISSLVFFIGGVVEVVATAGLTTTRLVSSVNKGKDICANVALGVAKMIFGLIMFISFFDF